MYSESFRLLSFGNACLTKQDGKDLFEFITTGIKYVECTQVHIRYRAPKWWKILACPQEKYMVNIMLTILVTKDVEHQN
jgi:hypothetical protein